MDNSNPAINDISDAAATNSGAVATDSGATATNSRATNNTSNSSNSTDNANAISSTSLNLNTNANTDVDNSNTNETDIDTTLYKKDKTKQTKTKGSETKGNNIKEDETKMDEIQEADSKGLEDMREYITTKGRRRKFLNRIFDSKDVPNHNSCDRSHPLPIAPSIVFKNPTIPVPKRTDEQKEAAKKIILAWRSKVFDKDWSKQIPLSVEVCVMGDEMVEKLSSKFANFTKPELVDTTLGTLLFLEPDHKLMLVTDLVELNRKIDLGDTTSTQLESQEAQCNSDQSELESSKVITSDSKELIFKGVNIQRVPPHFN
ncbi:hypothetical protein BGZ49_006370 [Haplosporangium sp. Z 27]|nr:hypothetical protein BGZ49_006370 [Haplosporangium sp. Z 27]